MPKFLPNDLHSYIDQKSSVDFVGSQKVPIAVLTEQYVVYNICKNLNLQSTIYSGSMKIALYLNDINKVQQKHPDCLFIINHLKISTM